MCGYLNLKKCRLLQLLGYCVRFLVPDSLRRPLPVSYLSLYLPRHGAFWRLANLSSCPAPCLALFPALFPALYPSC